MLVENTLYGEVDKVLLAVRRLQLNQPPEGYYVAFSGGKDSCVMRAWKKWSDKRNEGRIQIDVKLTRQLVKMHKKLYSQYRPHEGFKREYRNRNDRRRMMKKTWELIKQRNGVW